jgi:lipopolysaccharide/colanic/teichoic acid biosynthesis glycosyltransferase
LVFLPIILLICLAIKIDSPGPIFYIQNRVGKNGKTFGMFKFRSMVANADDFLLKHPEFMKKFKNKFGWKFGEANEDPRITRVGRFIRKYTLDELPQLLNIIRGEMSMVGPRAYRNDALGDEIEEQLKHYPHLREKVKLALSVPPGVSGPWQTSGRNKLSWEQRVELDAGYAAQKSILCDILIILKTPFVMFNKW